jgi:hypothetical protein
MEAKRMRLVTMSLRFGFAVVMDVGGRGWRVSQPQELVVIDGERERGEERGCEIEQIRNLRDETRRLVWLSDGCVTGGWTSSLQPTTELPTA